MCVGNIDKTNSSTKKQFRLITKMADWDENE